MKAAKLSPELSRTFSTLQIWHIEEFFSFRILNLVYLSLSVSRLSLYYAVLNLSVMD